MGFLSFIFITIMVFYLLGWVGKILLRWWLVRKQREFADQFGQDQGSAYAGDRRQDGADDARKKEGEVRVEQAQATSKKVNRNVGDYVEYEEVQDAEQEKQ